MICHSTLRRLLEFVKVLPLFLSLSGGIPNETTSKRESLVHIDFTKLVETCQVLWCGDRKVNISFSTKDSEFYEGYVWLADL